MENDIHSNGGGRHRRSIDNSGWTEQTLQFLHKLEKAVENFQVFEDQILSDINSS